MNALKIRKLLVKVAREYQQEKQSFSRTGLKKKLNEIKHLSSQKKVPKLTLRKEIVHLENQLEGIFELEHTLFMQKKRESHKVAALKRQIHTLQQNLAVAGDENVQQKVNKLTFLLGECLATKKTTDDVMLKRHGVRMEMTQPTVSIPVTQQKHTLQEETISKFHLFQKRVDSLKQELEITKRIETKDPAKIKSIEQNIVLFENAIQKFVSVHPELENFDGGLSEHDIVESPLSISETKHTLLFNKDVPTAVIEHRSMDIELEKELPLPPPPKMIQS
ncbi:hypothetical protein COV17_03075 [Candidatus Woesearchaeota archaeon CG10_big_fil_rev_8_21_14_0_10_36_11]|nr:MAG: hypothetical protein COV17_03075 [Candidatus Woesearchaeota archaeon CG10_big_fil_rev_8_21_14_0_10_36_11]